MTTFFAIVGFVVVVSWALIGIAGVSAMVANRNRPDPNETLDPSERARQNGGPHV